MFCSAAWLVFPEEHLGDQIPADDDDRHTSRTYVLLDTAPENTKLTHIDRL